MDNLFIRLIKLTHQREDFFTECLAVTLRENPTIAKAFLKRLYGQSFNRIDINSALCQITTQQHFEHSIVDMVITINNKYKIGIENKLWSPQGDGQLEKYTEIPELNYLAFITGYYNSHISENVMESSIYLKPLYREHFVWYDFFDLFQPENYCAENKNIQRSMLKLFTWLDFDPPHPAIGNLNDENEKVAEINRKNFKKLWPLTIENLRNLGWEKFASGTIAELYVDQGKSDKLSWVWINPVNNKEIKVRLNFYKNIDIEPIQRKLFDHKDFIHPDIKVSTKIIKDRVDGPEKVLDVRLPLKKLFENKQRPEELCLELSRFVVAIFKFSQ